MQAPPDGSNDSDADEYYTTNREDEREAARLQARLQAGRRGNASSTGGRKLPYNVKIDAGAHKYVLISAAFNGEHEYFVTSKRGAGYHRNAADPFIDDLENSGYQDIEIKGGGRLVLDEKTRHISIYGFSYSFGQPDHEIARDTILQDPRYKTYEVTTSNEGY